MSAVFSSPARMFSAFQGVSRLELTDHVVSYSVLADELS
jgi:hypothetical protein